MFGRSRSFASMEFTGRNQYVGCSSCGGAVKIEKDNNVFQKKQSYGEILANDKGYKTKALKQFVIKKHYKHLCFL